MKLTKKLFIAIMTMALLVVTFSASTFAWFTLGQEANIETINVNVTAGKGMELSLDGKKWTNTAKLTVAEGTVDFQDLTSADGIAIKTMENTAAKSNLSELEDEEKGLYFEQVIYVRITKGTSAADFTKVLLDYVAGKDATFTTTNGTAVSDTAPADANLLWVSDATLAGTYNSKQIAENKYYRFDPLNAVKISFQGKGTSANCIYGYENSESWGSAATDSGLAKDYAVAKEFSTSTAPTTLPASYTTYTASNATADANGFVKYDTKASTASEKASVLINTDFGQFADLGLSTGENPIYGDDVNYTYAKLTIRVWLEGWDADCINAILEKNTQINLGLKASN